jgi:hypothetical protein
MSQEDDPVSRYQRERIWEEWRALEREREEFYGRRKR